MIIIALTTTLILTILIILLLIMILVMSLLYLFISNSTNLSREIGRTRGLPSVQGRSIRSVSIISIFEFSI